MPSIPINKKKTKFFISISKQGPHSFIMLGVYDQFLVSHLLARVGKQADLGACFKLPNVFFNGIDSQLRDESFFRGSASISYQAYDITYEHYLEFIQLLAALQTSENTYKCYQPKQDENGDDVTLEYGPVSQNAPTKIADKVKEDIAALHLGNTCRHTAIHLVEDIQHAPVASLVSTSFWRELPCTTELKKGKPSEHIPFYVLPAPPKAFSDLDNTKRAILEKLYQRMEHLLLIDQHSEATQQKFTALKNLYDTLSGPQKQVSFADLLVNIHDWKEQNKKTLATLRKQYIWDFFITRQSATVSLINEIEQDLNLKR